MTDYRRVAKYAGIAVGGLVLLVVLGVGTGVLGAPSVDGVENRFANVTDTNTTIDTDLTIQNPNPIGVDLGGLGVDYTIAMNDVEMATGAKQGLAIESGTTRVPFSTTMNNTRIPAWWYTHVANGETTTVFIDVAISHGLLGGNDVSLPQEQTISTDIIGQFNDSTTRPVNANQPLVTDPVLYINETGASYGANLTRERTPLNMSFTVYNPKPYPYTVSEIGYTIHMNDVQVGSGTTADPYTIPGKTETTLQATTVIDNQRLDEWWVSHLERDQVTNLTIDFSLVVDPDTTDALGESVDPFRLDVPGLDYSTTIETDIFGTKASDGLHATATGSGEGSASTDDSQPSGEGSGDGTGSDSTATETTTQTETTENGDTQTATPTDTATDDGSTETTEDGGLLG